MSIPVQRSPRSDLGDPAEVGELVRRFYQAVAQDDLLGPVFNDVAEVDWSEHIPKLTAFWSRALLGLECYSGNPFRAHQLIHERSPFTTAHFERWLELFTETLDDGWTGPTAERALEMAQRVAVVHHRALVAEPSELHLIAETSA